MSRNIYMKNIRSVILGSSSLVSPFVSCLSLCLYLDPLWTSVNTTLFSQNYLNQALQYGRKSLTCLTNDFSLSEEYIFAKAMVEEFNNQYHQHQGSSTINATNIILLNLGGIFRKTCFLTIEVCSSGRSLISAHI